VEVVVAVIKRNKSALSTLSLAALALPGVIASAADSDQYSVDTLFSRYSESQNRMKIDAYQASAFLPLTDTLNFRVNGVKDVVTGASPVTYYPAAGKAKMIMSGASIADVRDAVDISASYTNNLGQFGVDVGRSSENDYNSSFFNIDSKFDFNQKNTTLALGYGFASDNVWAIDHCPPHCEGMVGNEGKYRRSGVGGDKQNHQGLIGITQLLDKHSFVQANLTYSYSGGYLSDPYKAVYAPWVTEPYPNYADSGFMHDTRPGEKHQIAFLTRYVRHFSNLNSAALHLDYRYYADTWNIGAHTFELSWNQPIVDHWSITPKFRYYSQNAAEFYQPYYTSQRTDGFYSSDYRLARFGSVSGGVQIEKQFFSKLSVGFAIDFYKRDYSYSINGGAGSPVDNFTFSILSANINYKF
jgi:hypothetical protein